MSDQPVSQKQLAANRANAVHSTGPRTPDGRSRAAQNARKHGFTASSFSVIRIEDIEELACLKDDLVNFYQPANTQQLFALERLAIAQQALLRAARFEAGLFTASFNEALDPYGEQLKLMEAGMTADIEVTKEQNRNYLLAEGFHRMVKQSNS